MKEEKEFQTESQQLLNLMINSIYSNQEVFLREIISNASDAIDKYRYLSLTDSAKYPQKEGEIRIVVDKTARSIEIVDNGLGMSKADMEKNLGTIAKSGSKEFLKKIQESKEAKDISIIGQFGVGFYSAFMVAQRVEVRSRPTGGSAHLFASDGQKTYTVEDVEWDHPDSGTSVKIFLKKDEEGRDYSSFLEDWKIEELVKKYSDYIRYPIKMLETRQEPDLDEKGKPIEGKTHEVKEDKTLNSMLPLWKKNPKDVTEAERNAFYKSKFDDYEDPLLAMDVHIEGVVCYDALLYIPAHAPYNLYSQDYEKGLALYSKGIFVQEKCKELLPDYLKFVKGLVDSDDFPLNISREMLQSSPALRKIADSIEKKIVDKLKAIQKDDPAKYQKFYDVYGDNLKYGIYSSYGFKKESLQDLLQFHSLSQGKEITLKQYEGAMKEGQKSIYYASGKTLEEAKLLPQIEKYRKQGIDVLLFDRDIDEFCIQMMRDYESKKFQNIASADPEEISKEEKDKLDQLTAEHKRILDDVKEALGDKVDEVSFSDKLVDSPVCIATKGEVSLSMEKTLKEQPGADAYSDLPKAKKVLEINPDHPLFAAIKGLQSDDEIKKYGSLLYDEAMLLEGYEVEDKRAFVSLMNELMIKAAK